VARKAGSIVLDRLRERILLGRYFGCWSPGDRLPSVRDVSGLEAVDRKTAAAAYRRLEREGLVRVEPRSGVYLERESRDEGGDPLRRLHRQWLEQTLGAAAELGLTTGSVARLLHAVAAVEERRIPVVDEDADHAALMAKELCVRTSLDCGPCRPAELPADSGPLRDAPFAVATPSAAARLRPLWRHLPLVQATLSPQLLTDVRRRARDRVVVVVVGTDGLARELEQARDHGLAGPPSRVRVARPRSPGEADAMAEAGGEFVVWPGAPEWAAHRLNGGEPARGPLLAEATVREMRRQVARAAVDAISRSSAAVPA
jgi:GntR family transcriptional regulator